MMTLQEYDLEIKMVNIIHRKGLYKLDIEDQDDKDEAYEEIFD
jgi:hypothetical protein